MEKEHVRRKAAGFPAESQVWPWCYNYKQQLFHFDMLSGVGCDISSAGICLFYTKSSAKQAFLFLMVGELLVRSL